MTHDPVTSDERLALLKAISMLIVDVDLHNRSLEAITSQLESLVVEQTGQSATIVWVDPSGSEPPRAAIEESPGSRLVAPIIVANDLAGWLTLESDEPGGLNEGDQLFTTVAARWIGAVHAVHRLRVAHRTAALFEATFDSTQVGMQLVDPDGTYLRVNEAFASMLGYSPDDLVGRRWQEFSPDDDMVDATTAAELASGERRSHLIVKRYARADGSIAWAKINVAPVFASRAGEPDERVHVTQVVDITAQVAATEQERELRIGLAESERRYRALLATAVDFVFRVDAEARIVELNGPALDAFVTPDRDVADLHISDLLPEHVAHTVAECVRLAAGEGRSAQLWREYFETPTGTGGWFAIRVIPEQPPPGDTCNSIFVVASDVSELVESEQRLTTLALVDPLTTTSNRAALFDRLQHALDRLDRHGGSGLAVAVLDVDHLKSINDTYGHRAGDESLIAVADVLRTVIRPQDSFGRIGGDEFVVVFEDVGSPSEAERLGERLSISLAATTIDVGAGGTRVVTASIGVGWTNTPTSIDELVGRADRAMYEAKRHGRGRAWLERPTDGMPEMPSSAVELREISAALLRNQFALHYQPIVERADGGVNAVEALIRWHHPERGVLTPNYFLGALLASGQIGPVGLWVCRTAIGQLAAWRDDPVLGLLTIHVNVSPGELANPALPSLLRNEFGATGLPPERLCLEITEKALAGTVVSTSALAELASTGVQLMLDDFGTGVSSLTHLRARPLHGIKIDRSFVQGAETDPGDRAIVEGVVAIAAGLTIDVVAEGVETREQAEWLTSLGHVHLQGFYFSRAVPADSVADLVAHLGAADVAPGHRS